LISSFNLLHKISFGFQYSIARRNEKESVKLPKECTKKRQKIDEESLILSDIAPACKIEMLRTELCIDPAFCIKQKAANGEVKANNEIPLFLTGSPVKNRILFLLSENGRTGQMRCPEPADSDKIVSKKGFA